MYQPCVGGAPAPAGSYCYYCDPICDSDEYNGEERHWMLYVRPVIVKICHDDKFQLFGFIWLLAIAIKVKSIATQMNWKR